MAKAGMRKFKVVCFDVDGTLADGNSWFLLTEGLGCSAQKHAELYALAKQGEFSFEEAERKLTKMYQESGKATQEFIREFFATIQPRPEAQKVISYLKQKGYSIYLISGAIDMYVKEIAKKLGVDGFYANSSLEFNEQGDLKKIHYRNNQGEVKVEHLRDLLKTEGRKRDEVVFVGDSENDIEVFQETGHGVAVRASSEELKRVAWKEIDSLFELKDIL